MRMTSPREQKDARSRHDVVVNQAGVYLWNVAVARARDAPQVLWCTMQVRKIPETRRVDGSAWYNDRWPRKANRQRRQAWYVADICGKLKLNVERPTMDLGTLDQGFRVYKYWRFTS